MNIEDYNDVFNVSHHNKFSKIVSTTFNSKSGQAITNALYNDKTNNSMVFGVRNASLKSETRSKKEYLTDRIH